MIKTLIFDFGDVFINLNKKSTFSELKKLGISYFSEEMLQINKQFEIGEINTKTFENLYIELFPKFSAGQIRNAWNAIILDFPEYRLEFIEALSKTFEFNLILLSNTNELHIEKLIESMTLERYLRFKNCFDFFYLSHEINLRKPDAKIFEFVLATHNLKPNDCFFVDDTEENTETAKRLGIHTWNIIPKVEDIVDMFTLKKNYFKFRTIKNSH